MCLTQNLTSPAGPQYYGSVTTEIQVTSAAMPTPLPAYSNPFDASPKTTFNSARRPSELPPALHVNTSVAPPLPHNSTGGPAVAPNAPGALSPIHTHNYPWSRERSASVFADAAESPATTLVSSTTNGSTFSSPFAAAAGRTANTNNNFESLSHSFNASQYTSISAGGGAPCSTHDDREPSPTRILTPASKRTTGESEAPHTRSSKRGSDETATSGGGKQQPQQGGQPQQQQPKPGNQNFFRRISGGTRRFAARLRNMDPVKLAYLRTSFVFAISILVTWTPSSINRVYTLIYPLDSSYGLNMAAAVVLPLQGVWNAVIYFTTSWRIFRDEMEATRAGRKVFAVLRLDRRRPPETLPRQSGGNFALGSSVRTPRSEMGRNRRLEGESLDGEGPDSVELQAQSPMTGSLQGPRRMSTMRVTQKQLDDFA